MTTDASVTAERCRILTAILLRHPQLVPGVADAYERLALPAPFDEIRRSITARSGKGRLVYKVREDVGQVVDQVLRQSPIPLPAIASRKGAERIWWRMFNLVPKEPTP
jgi:DNA primase